MTVDPTRAFHLPPDYLNELAEARKRGEVWPEPWLKPKNAEPPAFREPIVDDLEYDD